jgi:hypothetical protein
LQFPDIFTLSLLLIPIYEERRRHWYLILFDFQEPEIQIHDSAVQSADAYFEVIGVSLGPVLFIDESRINIFVAYTRVDRAMLHAHDA